MPWQQDGCPALKVGRPGLGGQNVYLPGLAAARLAGPRPRDHNIGCGWPRRPSGRRRRRDVRGLLRRLTGRAGEEGPRVAGLAGSPPPPPACRSRGGCRGPWGPRPAPPPPPPRPRRLTSPIFLINVRLNIGFQDYFAGLARKKQLSGMLERQVVAKTFLQTALVWAWPSSVRERMVCSNFHPGS